MTTVYVVTDVECGWDCVIGVYKTHEAAVAGASPHPDDYAADPEWYDSMTNDEGMYDTRIIHEQTLR